MVGLLVRGEHHKVVSVGSIAVGGASLDMAIHLGEHPWRIENLRRGLRVGRPVAVHLHVHSAIDILLLKVEVRGRLGRGKVVVVLAREVVVVNLREIVNVRD